jgi:hypothetical protein
MLCMITTIMKDNVYMYIHIYENIRICAYPYEFIILINMWRYTCIYFRYTCIYLYVSIYIYVYTYICMRICIYIFKYVYTYTYI